jgi:hypothetical protein
MYPFSIASVMASNSSLGRSDRSVRRAGNGQTKKRKKVHMKKQVTTTTASKVTTLSVEDINAATAALIALRGTMSGVKPLADVERREYYRHRLGAQTLRVLDNRVAAARQHRHLLPPSFDLRTFERETALVGALQQCVAATEQFLTTLQDALLPVASRAVQAGNVAYAHIKASPGAEEQIKRKVGKLSVHANRARSASPVEASTPPPASTSASPAPVTPSDSSVNKAA